MKTLVEMVRLKARKGGVKHRMRKDLYEQMSRALMRIIPRHDDGTAAVDFVENLKGHLSRKLWKGTSIQWWANRVKLDLEARRQIGRIKGSRPERWRRMVTY